MSRDYWAVVSGRRFSRRRALESAGAAFGMGAVLAACGGSSSPAGKGNQSGAGLISPVSDETKNVKRGGVVKARPSLDVIDFDPYVFPNAYPVSAFVYGGPFHVKDGYGQFTTGEIEGDVFESWEMSPDKLTLTGKVNANAHFPPAAPLNGRSATAQDIAASWDRYKQVSTSRSELSAEINPNAPIISMTATDDKTLVIKLKAPNATLPSLLASQNTGSFFVIPKEALDSKIIDLRRQPTVGTGPFYVSDFQPSVSYTMKKNPGFKQFKNFDGPYIDEIDWTFVPDYAAFLAAFRAGSFYTSAGYDTPVSTAVKPRDILETKQDIPALLMHETYWRQTNQRMYFSQLADSPFKDERVRQAFVLQWDRDLYIDTVYNVSKFQQAGVPLKTVAEGGLLAACWAGWFLDPRGAAFGANSKFFKQDLGMAKQLLTAAGFSNGVETTLTTPLQDSIAPAVLYQGLEALITMTQDSGQFKFQRKQVNFAAEWIAKWQNAGKGQQPGVGIGPANPNPDPVQYLYSYYNPNGKYVQGTDSTLDDLTTRAQREFDTKKAQDLVNQIQQYEGGKQFFPKLGAATLVSLNWPVLRNLNVYQGGTGMTFASVFLDPAQPPMKKG